MRSQHRFWRQSYVGALFTTAAMRLRAARQTAGVDFALATAQFLGKEVLEVSGFYLNTTKRAGSRGGAAFGARINMPNDPVYWHLAVREVQDGYDPAAGFVDRRGYRMIEPGMRYTVHTERGRYSPLSQAILLRGKLQHDLQSRRADRTRRYDVQLMRADLHSSDLVEFHLLPLYERLPRDFEISPGVILPAGGEVQLPAASLPGADDDEPAGLVECVVPRMVRSIQGSGVS